MTHKTLWAALAAAQAEMGRAIKDSANPAFRTKYADLASVMDACLPALNKHGIAVLQPTYDEDGNRYVKTILVHGETGEQTECRVPLIVGKNDMQGYGSAVTYARRYGLMGMAGVAPEDDDGNAAAKAAPRAEELRQKPDAEKFAGWCVDKVNLIHGLGTLDELKAFWAALVQDAPDIARDADVIRAKDERKAELIRMQKVAAE